MALPVPTYDLVLLLESPLDQERREQLLVDVENLVASGADIVNRQEWGVRPTAYEIRHKTDAEYYLLQFEGATRELLEELNRQLHIMDGVVRYRIIKLKPGTPEAVAPSGGGGGGGERAEPVGAAER